MITRSMDAAFFNALVNHPEVRPTAGGDGVSEADLSPLVLNPANICLSTEHGGWILEAKMPGVYELHTLFRRSGRGRIFKALAAEALHHVFTSSDILELLTRCPDDNPAARMAAIWVGFRERFRVGETSFQAITLDDWFLRDTTCWEDGRNLRIGLDLAGKPWPEEDTLTYAIGAALGMAKAGNLGKALGFFNRWSIFAGYGTIASPAPGLLDIGVALLDVGGGEVRVLR